MTLRSFFVHMKFNVVKKITRKIKLSGLSKIVKILTAGKINIFKSLALK